jgi:hypothetical protein
MNVVRLGPNHQIEGSGAAEAISEEVLADRKDIFVFSPETTMLMSHERQIEFHAQEWMLSKDMPPEQALMHREQYQVHSAAYDALAAMSTQAAGAEIIDFPSAYGGQPQQEQVAAA